MRAASVGPSYPGPIRTSPAAACQITRLTGTGSVRKDGIDAVTRRGSHESSIIPNDDRVVHLIG